MKSPTLKRAALSLAVLLFAPCTMLFAHDLFMFADSLTPKVGEKMSVRLVLGHNFPKGSTLPRAESLKVTLMSPDGKSSPLPTTASDIYQTVTFTPETTGAYMLAADYTYYSARTAQGMVYKPKNEIKDPVESSSYVSQNSKIILGAGGGLMLKPVGMQMEIVPQVDPATIKPGQALPIQVLWKGKPLASNREEEIDVKAVNAGFQLEEDTFAFAGHTDAKGMCRVKVTQAGDWLILVERKVPAADQTKAEAEVYKSTLVFHVGG